MRIPHAVSITLFKETLLSSALKGVAVTPTELKAGLAAWDLMYRDLVIEASSFYYTNASLYLLVIWRT